MRFIFDFILIIVFAIAFILWGLFVATAVIMAGCALQLLFHRWHDGKWDKFSLYLAAVVWVLGGVTLVLHNGIFIKWKPTIAYWLLSILFLTTQFTSKTPLLQKLLHKKITLPDFAWKKLNLIWGIFFLFLGGLNVYVIYHFSTMDWIYFKLICIGLSVVFLIGQSFYMMKHMPPEDK